MEAYGSREARLMRFEAHGFSLWLLPAEGALVAALRWRDGRGREHDLLRPGPGEPWPQDQPRRFGLWPLVPFANRAFGAVVDDGERRFSLPVNDPATGSTIHGFGWQNPWDVAAFHPDAVLMRHRRQGAGDPYDYMAEFSISLEPEAIRFDLSVMNAGPAALPFGLGLHPWFPAAADTHLRLAAAGELVFGAGYRATGAKALPGGGPFAADPAYELSRETAHSFIDWEGTATISTPSRGLALELSASPALRHPVLWSPAGADFLCFEPQSHAIGAPSEAAARAATPLQALGTGESLSGWMRIVPKSLG